MAAITGSQAGETIAGGAGDDILTAFAPGAPAASIVATPIAAGLASPIAVAAPDDGSGRLFILERNGQLKSMDLATGAIAPTPVLDLTGQIAIDGERGLLGLALHPDFAANGRIFVFLSQPSGTSEIREYRIGPDGTALPGSARTIIEIPQPGFLNHKGGWIGFGPDGMLHAMVGDGGGGGDPLNNAQSLDTLLGKVLRLDVDADDFAADPRRNYAIPDDNPFVGVAGLDEILAYGLRNPFRAGFDPATGQLFVGDVGQGEREEIDIVTAGGNYGWRLYEGTAPYNPPGGAPTAGLVFPIHDYTHASGDGRSVTGGLVLRGPSEALHGVYLFSDAISARLFALSDLDGDGTWTRTELTGLLAPTAGAIDVPVAFAAAPDGALLVVDLAGEVFRLDPVLAGPADAGDLVRGNGGRDIAYGGGGADTMMGGIGDDTLHGMADADRQFGEAGADLLTGGGGADTLVGATGHDTLDGGAGADLLAGGAGDDRYLVDSQADRVRDGATEGNDTVVASAGFRLYDGLEVLVLSEAAGAAQGVAAATASRVIGNAAANRLFGLGGNDTLDGGFGADLLDGGAGRDRLTGGAGTDTLRGGAGDDTLLVDSRADRVVEAAGGGSDTVFASGADGYWLPAGTEALVLVGTAGFGAGTAGGDTLLGSAQANRLFGLGGADWLDGRGGDDRLAGGAGADLFRIAPGGGADTITDFVPGEDAFVFGQFAGSSIVIATTPTAAGVRVSVVDDQGETSALLLGVPELDLLSGFSGGGISAGGGAAGGGLSTTGTVQLTSAGVITLLPGALLSGALLLTTAAAGDALL